MHHWIPSRGNASRIYSLTVILKHVSQHNEGIHEQRVKSRSFNKCAINYSCILFFVLIVNIVALDKVGGGGILTMGERNRVTLLLGLILSVCIEFNIEFARAAAAVHA